MAQEAAIRITADGSAVVAAAKQAGGALQGLGAQAGKMASSMAGASQSSEGLTASMRELDKSTSRLGLGANLLAKGMDMATGAILAAGAAVGASFVGKLVAVQREFDVLNSSLVTVSGSSAAAAREMAWLKDFAKETPFGLAQATQGFVKMKALGLDPSKAALTSFGNTASAMGKDLNQMVEAVADATTGEFERLKEFGIKAKVEGDRVALTFQGVSTTIGNSAAEINKYLIDLGNNQFGGAMAERAKTLDGTISALADSWDELFRTIGSSGVSRAMTNEIQGIDSYLGALTDRMNAAKASGAGMAGELSSGLGYVIARAPFDVLSSSANLLNGTLNVLTGGAIGLSTSVNLLPDAFKGSAQQAVALAQDLKRAEAEFAALKAQSDKRGSNIYIQSELASLALYIAKLKEAQSQKAGLTGVDPREVPSTQTRGASYARYEAEQAEATKALNAERMKGAGVTKEYIASIKVYQDALARGLITEKEATTGVAALTKKRFESSEAGKEAAKAETAGASAAKSAQTAYVGLIASINEKISADKATLMNSAAATESQKIRIKLDQELASGKLVLSAAHKAEALAALDSLAALEKQIKAAAALLVYDAERLKISEELDAAYVAESQAREQGRQAVTDYAKGINDSNEALQYEYSLMGQSEQARTIALEQYRIELDLKKQIAAVDSNGGFDEAQRETERARLRTAAAAALDGASDKVALDQWKTSIAQYDEIFRKGFADMVNGGQNAWKSFTKSLVTTFKTSVADQLYKMFVKPFVMKIVASLLGVSGGAVAGAANAATGQGEAGSGLPGMASNASSLYSTASSLATIGTQVAAGTMSLANALGTVAANTTGTGISGLLAANGAYGTAAAGSASAMAGSVTSALAAIPGWGWAALAAVAVASIFGGRGKKEATGSGIEGNFSGTGFAGNNFSTWKQDGGWFHNDRTGKETSALDAATAKQFTDAYGAVKTSAAMAAVSLGLSADAITNYSQSVSLQLGSDAAANEKAVADLFAGIGDNMALAAAPGIALLSKEGESVSTTLARLSGSLTTANAWLSMLRQRLFQVGLAGGDAASKLADAFGGLENLTAASQSFYTLYYSEGERAARTQEDMVKALALVNLSLPTTKAGLRDLAGSLDLNTDAGRTAYAVLLAIAPEFAAAADQASKIAQDMAQEMAARLLETFSGRQQLIPLLGATLARFDALSAGLTGTAGSALTMGNATGWINTQLGNASSGLLFFGDRVGSLSQPLSGAQLAAQSLSDQILDLRLNAGRTVTDIAGLSAALANVNTETFMATMQGVLSRLGEMFSSVLGDIASERIATREAALAIINPTVMGKDQITRGIAGANVGMPSNAGMVAAAAQLSSADAKVAQLTQAQAGYAALREKAVSSFNDAYLTGKLSGTAVWGSANGDEVFNGTVGAKFDALKFGLSSVSEAMAGRLGGTFGPSAQTPASLTPYLAPINDAVAYIQTVLRPLGSMTTAQAAQTTAAAAAKAATLAYIDSLQVYAIDASKATARLGKLREETVKYYESQKALADLMAQSAGTLRQSVADYRYSQLSPEQQYNQLQSQFNTAYSMALSTSGETLAGYGDKLNGLLNPLLEKAKEAGLTDTAYSQLVSVVLARAEAVAGRIDALTPTNYAADSLAMLGQIDTTLAALEAGSKSAERIITDAINLGRDQTVNGLRQVVNALTGQGVSYFAAGGAFTNGIASGPTAFNVGMMGEAGSEGILPLANVGGRLGVHATGGGSADVVAELRALRQDNANMRAELRALVTSNAAMLRMAQRAEVDGTLVRNDADTPLVTVAA